jgi:hypothetical protein
LLSLSSPAAIFAAISFSILRHYASDFFCRSFAAFADCFQYADADAFRHFAAADAADYSIIFRYCYAAITPPFLLPLAMPPLTLPRAADGAAMLY